MFCANCGNDVEAHARFCSKCGQEVAKPPEAPAQSPAGGTAGPVAQKPLHDMDMHINILGWLLVGCGILTGVIALMILFAGQVIRHVPFPIPPGLPAFVGWVTSVVGLAAAALAAGIAAAGVGLLQYKSWARVLAIIMAVLLVFHFPIGTVIAVYAFWVLFSQEGQDYFNSRSASTMTASGL